MLKRNRQRGFTLIELLIVVAIIGIIAAILIPNLLDALQKAKQKRTTSDVRNTGTAWLSWLTDQVGAASAGSAKQYEPTNHQGQSYENIYWYLRPTDTFFYMQEIPQIDGWRNDLSFTKSTRLLDARVLAIYAQCRDSSWNGGAPPQSTYLIEPFLATDYDHDIVWADGYFVQWPEGTKRTTTTTP